MGGGRTKIELDYLHVAPVLPAFQKCLMQDFLLELKLQEPTSVRNS